MEGGYRRKEERFLWSLPQLAHIFCLFCFKYPWVLSILNTQVSEPPRFLVSVFSFSFLPSLSPFYFSEGPTIGHFKYIE